MTPRYDPRDVETIGRDAAERARGFAVAPLLGPSDVIRGWAVLWHGRLHGHHATKYGAQRVAWRLAAGSSAPHYYAGP